MRAVPPSPSRRPAKTPVHSPLVQTAPDVYDHPDAARSIQIGDRTVAYAFHRSTRRSIGLAINHDGLTVTAPQRATTQAVDTALREKAHWILDKLAQAASEVAREQAQRIDWRDGAVIPYLGAPLVLRLARAANRASTPELHDDAAPVRTLALDLAPDATGDAIRAATQSWLTGRARRLFTTRLDAFAPELGVHWQRMRVSSAATRWGSASRDGSIRLNWRLIHFAAPIIDYVVVHELAHLLEMNHGARFWAHVARVLPDYAERRRVLKTAVLPPW